MPFSECRHSSGAVSVSIVAVLVAGSTPREALPLTFLTVLFSFVLQEGYLFSRTSGEACLK